MPSKKRFWATHVSLVQCNSSFPPIIPARSHCPNVYWDTAKDALRGMKWTGYTLHFWAVYIPGRIPCLDPSQWLILCHLLLWTPSLLKFFLESSWFATLCWFLLYPRVNQFRTYWYMCPVCFRFFSHVGYHSIEQGSQHYTAGPYSLSEPLSETAPPPPSSPVPHTLRFSPKLHIHLILVHLQLAQHLPHSRLSITMWWTKK